MKETGLELNEGVFLFHVWINSLNNEEVVWEKVS